MKKGYICLMFLFVFALLVGCNKNSNQLGSQAADIHSGRAIFNFEDDNGRPNVEQVRDDVTGDNPNFLNLGRGERNTQYLGYEVQKVREVLSLNKKYREESIIMNGQEIHVNVSTKKDLSKKEQRKAKKELREKLQLALPYHRIHVEIENN